MKRYLFIIIFMIFYYGIYSQEGLNMRLNSIDYSTADALFVDEEYAYIIGTALDPIPFDVVLGMQDSFRTIQENVSIGKFYKFNLESNIIEDSIEFNSNPINFEIESSKLYNINDTLHYFTVGREFIDTVFQDSTNFQFYPSYYLHFRYSLSDGKWDNKIFPAINELGVQDVRNNDAFISKSGIYITNRTQNTAKNKSDFVITKLDHNCRTKWNVKFENQLFHLAMRILEDRKGNIVLAGVIDSLTNNRRNGYRHLFLQKLDSENGNTVDKFVLEENSTLPNAFIEDPNGGYIVFSGDAVFQEGGRYPAITQILKIDKNLDSICWRLHLSEDITYSRFWQLDNFTSLGNNEFIAVGIADDPLNTGGNVGRIIKFTGDGEVIFDKEVKHYSPNDNLEQRITDISRYKDGFIACGTIRHYFNSFDFPERQGWIVHVNQNGNSDISSSTNTLTIEEGVLNIFPNPSNGQIYFEFEKELDNDLNFIIYSIGGTEVNRGTISKGQTEYNIQLELTLPGIYVVRLITKNSSSSKLIQIH